MSTIARNIIAANTAAEDPALTRAEITALLKSRFYVDERATLVQDPNRPADAIFCFPSDVRQMKLGKQPAAGRITLDEIVLNSVNSERYIKRIDELNALQHIPTHREGFKMEASQPLALGLYLYMEQRFRQHYLAHEARQQHPQEPRNTHEEAITSEAKNIRDTLQHGFLAAILKAKGQLNTNEYYSETLLNRTLDALHLAGLTNFLRGPDSKYDKRFFPPDTGEPIYEASANLSQEEQAIRDWYEKGEYTINGERHYIDEAGLIQGTFAQTAQKIYSRSNNEDVNPFISFVTSFTGGLSESWDSSAIDKLKAMDDAQIDREISHGIKIRYRELEKYTRSIMGAIPPLSQEAEEKAAATIDKIIAPLADAELEILLHDRSRISYSNAISLRPAWPLVITPGEDPAEFEKYSQPDYTWPTGMRHFRYQIMFISNSYRVLKPEHLALDPDLDMKPVSWVCKHEATHMAISHMTIEMRLQLLMDVKRIHDQMVVYPDWHVFAPKPETQAAIPANELMQTTSLNEKQLEFTATGMHEKTYKDGKPAATDDKRKPQYQQQSRDNNKRFDLYGDNVPAYFYERPAVFNDRSLAELVDFHSSYYMGYYHMLGPDDSYEGMEASLWSKWEEVVCQVSALMATAYRSEDDAIWKDIPALGTLRQHILEYMEYARQESRKEAAKNNGQAAQMQR